MRTVGYIQSEFVSTEEISDLKRDGKAHGVEFVETIEDVEMVLVFSDHDLLSLVDKAEKIPAVLVVETRTDFSFFAQASFDSLDRLLTLIQDDEYEIEKRMMMEVDIGDKTLTALNDVYISSSYPNTRMRFDILVDNRSIYDDLDSSNGILFSTPTGSTAMALNLGGAIIHSSANVFQLLTVAARNTVGRHQIISAGSQVDIEILDTQYPLFTQVDSKRIETDTRRIGISKSPITFKLAILRGESGFSSLQRKLTQKLSYEDTEDLTSSAKFILHVLQQESMGMTVKQIMEITHLQNQKTIRNSLNLLISKGLVVKRDNLEDLREHIYSFVNL